MERVLLLNHHQVPFYGAASEVYTYVCIPICDIEDGDDQDMYVSAHHVLWQKWCEG